MAEPRNTEAARTAMQLLRASRAGSLATADGGQPFASLVTPATSWDGTVLLLLSGLSPHTRHLRAEPRCSLMVLGPPTGPNPQTAPRLSLVGAAAPAPDPALKARWLALHPYAGFYADLPDFVLWRLQPETAQFVGGFASAHRFRAADLLPPAPAAAALAAAEPGILAHCNADHPDAMDAIARAHGGEGDGWRMVGCDPDGCDLARGEEVRRVPWSAPVADAGAVRSELVRLAAQARQNPIAMGAGPSV